MQLNFQKIRQKTLNLCEPLETEDFVVQGQKCVSPVKWHLAHSTWFFEKLILSKYQKSYKLFNPVYLELFNSYYKTFGNHWTQADRGLLSRPSVKEVFSYRNYIDEAIQNFLLSNPDPEALELLELGMQHEMQHQELMLMDILYNFSINPLYPKYCSEASPQSSKPQASNFVEFSEASFEMGNDAKEEFAYDNEQPKHKCFVRPFGLQNQLVTNGEYLEFILAKGYEQHQLWHSDGWQYVQEHQQQHPLYWRYLDGQWYEFSLYGLNPLDLHAPVSHLNYYEASAYAWWKDKRLPLEQEWEYIAQLNADKKNALFLENDKFKSCNLQQNKNEFQDLFGNLWEWTATAYQAHPGYKVPKGALGEYNHKFMLNQLVLKGGSFASSHQHIRSSYRNFYYPDQSWMFSGLRLACDL